MVALAEVRSIQGWRLPASWRAALIVLRERLPRDPAVWECVSPGVTLDLRPVIRDTTRPMRTRTLCAVAHAFVNDDSMMVPFDQLIDLSDRDLRSVLDALAVVRGGLPID